LCHPDIGRTRGPPRRKYGIHVFLHTIAEYNKKLDDLRKKLKEPEKKIDTILRSGKDNREDLKQKQAVLSQIK
jgi:hypothetical protein